VRRGYEKISETGMSDPLFIIAGSVTIRRSVWEKPVSEEIPAEVVAGASEVFGRR